MVGAVYQVSLPVYDQDAISYRAPVRERRLMSALLHPDDDDGMPITEDELRQAFSRGTSVPMCTQYRYLSAPVKISSAQPQDDCTLFRGSPTTLLKSPSLWLRLPNPMDAIIARASQEYRGSQHHHPPLRHCLKKLHLPLAGSLMVRRVYTTNPKDQQWFGYQCRVAADNKYRAWQHYKRHPTQVNKARHRRACKIMVKTAKWAKARWELDIKKKLSSNQVDAKQWWNLVKERQGISHQNVVITEDDVGRLLRGVNTRKAPGPDGLSPHILKNCATELTTPLTLIFRQCLQTGEWPSLWKEARITPVHKKRSRAEPGNYRPISLLSVVSKIFERIIGEQINKYLEENHLLSPKQFGFRKGRSTSDLLLLLSKSWHDALDAGRPSLVIALDIAGAFDSVWHHALTTKLQQLGITGDLLQLFTSYLTGRSLRVVVNGSTSSSFPVEASVPQGSVLGPILWNIYFNDLLQSSPEAAAYADDCTLSWAYERRSPECGAGSQ
ncbi:uncharacterized protein LOC123500981 [Portunus trituberculatus]|uniref:uncharacterized protein LOC123500981 n=1 Tax=Portunus trituberculatus TaxID=210409 RepID=UPI001E1CF0B5|nr:uncharacterized protein LOC123500981 [Portunus trituberculatus]